MWDIILTIVCILLGIYLWLTWEYDYWEKRDVKYIKPTLLFGNTKDLILMRRHMGEVYLDFCRKYPKEPAIGIYTMLKPQLVLTDIDLIKTVTIKEFSSFHDNVFGIDLNMEPLFAVNPFLAKGEKWKELRTFHSHALSSVKTKTMHPLMIDVCKEMVQFIQQIEDKPLEVKYLSEQFTSDVVASCIFGLKTNSFLDPNEGFIKMTKRMFEMTFYNSILMVLLKIAPSVVRILKLRWMEKEVANFYVNAVKDLCEYRTKNKVIRADFLQTLIDENLKNDVHKSTYERITSYTMTFLLDGFETSSTLMSYVIYLLSLYPEYQEKIRQELPQVEQLTYEEVYKCKHLDAFVNETLRLFPPGLVLTKLCTKDITLKAGDRKYPLTKGTAIAIPIFAVHRNPNYFHEPTQFIPDRFYDKQLPAEFMPFGLGPRICLGSRFALTQVKTGLAYLIKHFYILPKELDAKLPEINKTSTFIRPPRSGLWVKCKAIKEN